MKGSFLTLFLEEKKLIVLVFMLKLLIFLKGCKLIECAIAITTLKSAFGF